MNILTFIIDNIYFNALQTLIKNMVSIMLFFQSVTLYSASYIVERIISRSSVQSKLYTVVVSALYTAVEGK